MQILLWTETAVSLTSAELLLLIFQLRILITVWVSLGLGSSGMKQPSFKNHKNWCSINILQSIVLLQGAHLLQTVRVQWRSGVADGEIVDTCPRLRAGLAMMRFKGIHRGRDL